MTKALIIAAAKMIDQAGCMQHCLGLESRILKLGHELEHLIIEPLSADWHGPEKPGYFRSGCAPVEALEQAKALLEQGHDAVLISGEDKLKSGYRREQRLKLMSVYRDGYPLTQVYPSSLGMLFSVALTYKSKTL